MVDMNYLLTEPKSYFLYRTRSLLLSRNPNYKLKVASIQILPAVPSFRVICVVSLPK